MLAKLNELYDNEDELIDKYIQLKEDVDFLQTMIMYQYNKKCRKP